MRLFIDLNTGRITEGVGVKTATSLVQFKTRNSEAVEVIFHRNGVIQELKSGGGELGELGIKAVDDYDGDFLVYASSWTKAGTGTSTIYTFTPNFNTTELLAEFTDGTVEYVDAVLEITWSVDGAVASSAEHTACRIWQDIVQGTEGDPEPATPATVVATVAAMTTPGFYELSTTGDLYWVGQALAPIKLT